MWLITTLTAAILATIAYFLFKKKYKLGFLSLMFWGSSIMILVDHILGYEGGPFLETRTNGLITNAYVLGLVMLLPALFIWLLSLLVFKKSVSKN